MEGDTTEATIPNNEEEETTAKTKDDIRDESHYSLAVKSEYILDQRAASLPPIRDEYCTSQANTKRPRDSRDIASAKLCPKIVQGLSCDYGDSCRFLHDVQVALADRPEDITVEAFANGCPVYESFGYCGFGLTCRFGSSHINMTTGVNQRRKPPPTGTTPENNTGETISTASCDIAPVPSLNVLDKDFMMDLRKKKHTFVCPKGTNLANVVKQHSSTDPIQLQNEKSFDPLPSKTRKLIDFSNKVYIAPLTTVGNLPYRRVMKRLGADITCGEMAVAFNLLEGKQSEWALLKRHPEEDIFGVQIAAGHPDQFARIGELIECNVQADFVDLNLGCPLDIICNRGCGAGLMRRDQKVRDSLHSLSYMLRKIPFTVKMRTGWDEKKPFAHELVRKIQSFQVDGLAAVMVHGRSRLQRYSKEADWDYVNKVLKSQDSDTPKIPIIGNGDIMSYHDYETKVLAHEGLVPCAMLARGALIKPWLPTEIKEKRQWDISSTERFEILKDFVRFGLEHWGSDQRGVNNCRRFLLEWLSFLHRYVPVGLLEQSLPQRMNQRPPKFFMGRNDLETLFLSDHCSDWVKISELLLGPVPDDFRFEPKHKARAYKPEGYKPTLASFLVILVPATMTEPPPTPPPLPVQGTHNPSQPLNIGDTCQVFCSAGNCHLAATIVERRPSRKDNPKRKKVDVSSLAADDVDYYVHYNEHDRRLDEWVTLDKFDLATFEECKEEDLANRNVRRRSSGASSVHQKTTDDSHHDATPFAFTGGNWHRSNSGDPATTAFEQEHEEITKVKNIEKIVMGDFQVAAWYYSPFPAEYSDVETLYVCEFCLSYMKLKKTLKKHKTECPCRQPPGKRIYKHEDLAVYELDGKDHLAYCQKLCLLAKLFLDHKTLYYDVTPFYFYVITKVDAHGAHIVGYFSKEKFSTEGYNLACILTFPQYQKAGYGKFIISLSYELTKKEGITGSPEKPLSDLGKLSYRSYWTYILMHVLAGYSGEGDLTINDISTTTGIKMEDIISTLQHLEMIKVWKGQHVVYVRQDAIAEYMKKERKFRLCKPQYLEWTPPEALKGKENS